MNFCGTCGEQVRAGWVFCEACGMSLRAAAGGEATAQYSVPIPARKEPDRPRSQDPDPWRRPTPVPPPAVEAVTELPVTRRSNLPVARALAIVLAVATLALGFGLYTTNSKLADSRDAVSNLTQQNHKQASTIDARDAQISALRSNTTQLHETITSCQRTAAVMARTWQLTDQARGWTLKAVEAAAFGDYVSAGYYLERSSGPLRQGRGLITGAGDDIKTCIGNAGSGSSGSIS